MPLARATSSLNVLPDGFLCSERAYDVPQSASAVSA
jgi:hypothetical protein